MTSPELDAAVRRRLTARGIRALEDDERSPEMVLGVIREQRRRHADSPRLRALGELGSRLAGELVDETGVAPADIVKVLVAVASKLGALAVSGEVDAHVITEIMGLAADDIDRQANGGEPS